MARVIMEEALICEVNVAFMLADVLICLEVHSEENICTVVINGTSLLSCC
jgi:hypothetical protein